MTQSETLDILQPTFQKTHEWLAEFTEHTGRHDEHKAWQMMRAALHVLRDRLTIDECAHLSAQLPLIIRGLYFEGWKPSDQPVKLRTRDEFIQAVADQLTDHPEIDPNQAIEGTFHVLNSRITAGEIEKIKGAVQPELKALWPQG